MEVRKKVERRVIFTFLIVRIYGVVSCAEILLLFAYRDKSKLENEEV